MAGAIHQVTTTVLGHFPFKWSIHALNGINFNLRTLLNINFMQLPTQTNKKNNYNHNVRFSCLLCDILNKCLVILQKNLYIQ